MFPNTVLFVAGHVTRRPGAVEVFRAPLPLGAVSWLRAWVDVVGSSSKKLGHGGVRVCADTVTSDDFPYGLSQYYNIEP